MILVLPVMFAALLFEGWTNHEVDAAKTRRDCSRPVAEAVANGGPVSKGSAVKWDVPQAKKLFAELRNDQPVTFEERN